MIMDVMLSEVKHIDDTHPAAKHDIVRAISLSQYAQLGQRCSHFGQAGDATRNHAGHAGARNVELVIIQE
jgi:hypothetical protein